MNKKDLKVKLDILNVDSSSYSLEGEFMPDSIILYNSYNNWEVFYFDERGNRNNENVFENEHEACEYIYKLFEKSKIIENKYLKK